MNTKQVKRNSKRRVKSVEEKTVQLLKYESKWGTILRACVEESKRTKNNFAGAWVFWRLKEQSAKTPVNLRKLTGLKVLVKTKSTRGGKRAYYAISDVAAIERALKTASF